MKNLEVSEKGG